VDPKFGPKVVDPEFNAERGRAGVQWADVLALAGDSSDNVPGVKGIGQKGALALIQQYGSLEAVLQRASEVPPVNNVLVALPN
jgi:5'-3' exonuclease